MAIYKIIRSNRQEEGYMEQLIAHIWNLESQTVFKRVYGAPAISSESIIDSFRAVHNVYPKLLLIRVHHMELIFDEGESVDEVIYYAQQIGSYLFFNEEFQNIVSVIETYGGYIVKIIVNAISYTGRKTFHDNNVHNLELFQFIQSLCPNTKKFKVTENTFFSGEKR